MAEVAKNLLKIIVGIILLIVAAWILISFSTWTVATWRLIQGGIVLTIILIGIAFLILGFSDLKS